jgi:aspartate racemase
MHIGLFGGTGSAATNYYYRKLIAAFATAKADLEITIVHAGTPTFLSNVASNDTAAQVALYMKLTKRLVAAGAKCVVVTSIAGHFCIKEFKLVSPLPVVDMIPEINRTIQQRGLKRIGIIGTRAAMETRLFGGVSTAEIIPPSGHNIDDVHKAYIEMATTGIVTEAQRMVFYGVCHKLINEDGVEAIMLGGTDLALAFDEKDAAFPLVDCAGIHVDAVARLALS